MTEIEMILLLAGIAANTIMLFILMFRIKVAKDKIEATDKYVTKTLIVVAELSEAVKNRFADQEERIHALESIVTPAKVNAEQVRTFGEKIDR